MKTLKLKTLLTGAALCMLSASFAQDTTHMPAPDTTTTPSTDTTPKTDTTSFVSPSNGVNSSTGVNVVSSETALIGGVANEAKVEEKVEKVSGK